MLVIVGNLSEKPKLILTEICYLSFLKSSKKTSVLLYKRKNVAVDKSVDKLSTVGKFYSVDFFYSVGKFYTLELV